MDLVNEQSSYLLDVAFDENKVPVTPSGGTYRIDDVDSGMQILGETPFTPAGATHRLVITPAQNALLNTTNPSERRRVTIVWQYGSGKQGTAEYVYTVRNLAGVS